VDWTIFQFLAPAIAASLIIAGIHAYLGLHVVERGVIFVDLSLAQIASLGAAIAVWQGFNEHDPSIYWMSLGFTLIGAFIFAMVKGHEANIPQEAIIGITYAVASAAVILTLSKATGEAQHLQNMLVGNILSVQWPEVFVTGGIYLAIGIFHYIFRKRFLEISIDTKAARHGMPVPSGISLLCPSARSSRAGRDRGRPARLLLSHRAVGRRHTPTPAHRRGLPLAG
jgi:zinc/manganese transport system permease protein